MVIVMMAAAVRVRGDVTVDPRFAVIIFVPILRVEVYERRRDRAHLDDETDEQGENQPDHLLPIVADLREVVKNRAAARSGPREPDGPAITLTFKSTEGC